MVINSQIRMAYPLMAHVNEDMRHGTWPPYFPHISRPSRLNIDAPESRSECPLSGPEQCKFFNASSRSWLLPDLLRFRWSPPFIRQYRTTEPWVWGNVRKAQLSMPSFSWYLSKIICASGALNGSLVCSIAIRINSNMRSAPERLESIKPVGD
ncbi:uncharacterized protein BJX67DRAFT_252741 [Aspergillus lucknowensis]|uniref:Uncharacterized protein n=1 Tax=Aspergillus lucknowensis TaxID=176173 RepID=A0ABR4LG74_9EURO